MHIIIRGGEKMGCCCLQSLECQKGVHQHRKYLSSAHPAYLAYPQEAALLPANLQAVALLHRTCGYHFMYDGYDAACSEGRFVDLAAIDFL